VPNASSYVPEGMSQSIKTETDFHIFVRGWINIWGDAAACFGRGLVERPKKKFNKICFLGLHGEI
jgi:hypothetical protein